MFESVHAVLRMATTLGYELSVTGKTIDEFHESLHWQMTELQKKPPVPAELVRIAIDHLDENSFLALYWREFVENGTSIEEFVAEKTHLGDILEGLGISTTNNYREEIENSEALAGEMSILRSVCSPGTSEHIIEHDVFHRLFIERVRGKRRYQFSNAVAWFLTHDRKLPHYARVARKGKNYRPFCITTDQWVQINRPLLARTKGAEEYERSFHVLVTQPFLRTMISSFSLGTAYNEVLGRLARYKNMNPQLALNLVANKQFMVTLASEADPERIDEKIESELVDVAAELQAQTSRDHATIQGLDHELQEETRRRLLAEEEAETLKTALATRSTLVRWGVFLGLLLATSLLLWFHHRWFGALTLLEHRRSILIRICSEGLLFFALLSILIPKRWETWLAVSVALVIAILTSAFT